MRKIVIAGNWKMYKTQSEAKTFFSEFPAHLKNTASQAAIADQQILICVPYTNLAILQTILPAIGQANLSIGAQNVHWA